MSPWPSQSSAQSPQLWAGPAVRPAGQPDSCDPLSNLHATLSATPPGRPKTWQNHWSVGYFEKK